MCEGNYPSWLEISFHFLVKNYTLIEKVPKVFVSPRGSSPDSVHRGEMYSQTICNLPPIEVIY